MFIRRLFGPTALPIIMFFYFFYSFFISGTHNNAKWLIGYRIGTMKKNIETDIISTIINNK